MADDRGLRPVALTFDPHPLEFLAPERAPLLLTTVEQREELLGRCGVDILGVLPFLEIRDLEPVAFVTEILVERLRAVALAVGADFRFGRDRVGDTEALAGFGDQYGFSVDVVEMVGHGPGGVISSTRIRKMIAEGEVARAADLLGRPFELVGPVIHGDARGTSIGFPTANLHVPDRMAVPLDGVYAAFARVLGEEYPAVVNIGVRPTFGVSQRTVEAHLIGADVDIYGDMMTLAFVRRIRPERRFAGVEELKRQIAADSGDAARILEREEA